MRKLFLIFSFILLALPAFAEQAEIAASALASTDDMEVIGLPTDWAYGFQESSNPLAETIDGFHNYLLVIITSITIVVMALMAFIVIRFNRKNNPNPDKKFTHSTWLEVAWTMVPIAIVIAIIIPSMRVLYEVDRTEEADMTLNVIGYQWYWGYEYPEYGIEEFESRLLPEEEISDPAVRLLEVDNPVYLPVGKTIRVMAKADPLGVIHAWGIPALRFKRDNIPGRVNEGWIRIDEPGIYYGQCYELCGPDHAFMPIKIVAVEEDEFNKWVIAQGGKPIENEEVAEEEAEEEIEKSMNDEG